MGRGGRSYFPVLEFDGRLERNERGTWPNTGNYLYGAALKESILIESRIHRPVVKVMFERFLCLHISVFIHACVFYFFVMSRGYIRIYISLIISFFRPVYASSK